MKNKMPSPKIVAFFDNRVRVIQGDITLAGDVGAIVNAANAMLEPGGGVDGAIHHAAGPELALATAKIGFTNQGQAVITPGFRLKAKHVIHAVGPIWMKHSVQDQDTLKQTYLSVFNILNLHSIKTVAIPNISTGAYHFPKVLAGHIAIKTTLEYIKANPWLERVDFYCFEEDNYQIYVDTLKNVEGR